MDQNQEISPEEVAALQNEVDDLATQFASSEQTLRDLRIAIDDFEIRYREKIATRFAIVQELEAELAALRGIDATAAEERAAEARRVAENQTPKERYKNLVKRIHPDKFTDPRLKSEAEDLMKRLTAAWDKGDTEEIGKIEVEVERRFGLESTPTERFQVLTGLRVRLLSQIGLAQGLIDAFQTGALWNLFAQSEDARAEGRNFLDEQAAELDAIAVALREEISALSGI
jgi:hypothetical protein